MRRRWLAVEMYVTETSPHTSENLTQGRHFQKIALIFFAKPLLLWSPLHRMMMKHEDEAISVWMVFVRSWRGLQVHIRITMSTILCNCFWARSQLLQWVCGGNLLCSQWESGGCIFMRWNRPVGLSCSEFEAGLASCLSCNCDTVMVTPSCDTCGGIRHALPKCSHQSVWWGCRNFSQGHKKKRKKLVLWQ